MNDITDNKILLRTRKPIEGEVFFEWASDKIELMILKLNGQLIVVNAVCPHMGARLELNKKRKKIVCPWHGLDAGLHIHQDHTNRLKCNHHKYQFINLYKFQELEDEIVVFYQ